MNRRTVLKGGFVLAATAHTAVAVANPAAGDPLLSAIRAYQASINDFNRLANGDNDWNEIAQATYALHLNALNEWTKPATSLEGAREALRITLTDEGGIYGCDKACESMIRAALAYLEGRSE